METTLEQKNQPTERDEASRPQAKTPPTPKRRVWWLGGVLLLVAAIGGYFYWSYSSVRESTDDAQVDGRLYPVSPRVGGTVVKVLVSDNQVVEAGTVLVEIDPKDYEVAVDLAKAELAESQATLQASTVEVPVVRASSTSQLSVSQANIREANAAVAAAEKQVDAATARFRSASAAVRQQQAITDRAAKDLERMKPLIAKEEISQQAYDAVVSSAAASRAQLDAVQAQVHEAEEGIRVAQSQLAQQRARLARAEADAEAAQTAPQQVAASRARASSSLAKVEQKKAELEQARLNAGYTVIRAATNGVVSQKSVVVGQVVQPGQPLMALVPLDDIWITANYKENQLSSMRPGQPVEIDVDAYPDRTYKGHVDSIAAATGSRFSLLPPENATGNFVKVVQRVPVKIVLDKGENQDHLLRPGMSVVPTVLTQ